MLDTLTNIIALSLSTGDQFLPSTAEYDDLFYKLVETGDGLVKFRDLYGLSDRNKDRSAGGRNSISILIGVSEHYYRLIDENLKNNTKKATAFSLVSGGETRTLSPSQGSEVIKNGYETLSIGNDADGAGKERLGDWEKYREAGEARGVLKKIARVVVADAKGLMEESL